MPIEKVILFYGEAETGKTTLAMQCAVFNALQGFKTLFVDADSKFSVERLCQISIKQKQTVVEQILLARPHDFREQSTIVDQFSQYLKANVRLAIFDTITSLYRVRVAENSSRVFDLNRELNRQMAVLAQTARTRKVAILLTSQVHATLDRNTNGLEPVATRVLGFWSDIVIALKLADSSGGIQATIEKNPMGLPQITFSLIIDEKGIHD